MDHFQTQRQKEMCEDCFFCDEKAIGKGPCCTFPGILECDDTGVCITRKERTEIA